MPCEVKWLIDKRLISVRFLGTVSVEDVRQQTQETHVLIAQGTPPVHVLLDSSDVEGVSIGISDLRNLAAAAPPQTGWTIIIAPNTLYRFFISVGMQFTRSDYKFVKSQQEAVEYLRERDPSLGSAPE